MPIDDCDRPAPPREIHGEALAEWDRVCDELAQNGQLAAADRAILILYVETWEIYRLATEGTTKHGPIVKHGNGVAGPSPFYKVARETSAQLQRILADLGLTPAARHKMKIEKEDGPDDLDNF